MYSGDLFKNSFIVKSLLFGIEVFRPICFFVPNIEKHKMYIISVNFLHVLDRIYNHHFQTTDIHKLKNPE